MENVAVVLARASGWVESNDLNPRGSVFFPDFVKAIIARYGFMKFPEKLEEFDEGKGVTFVAGKLGHTVIEQVIVYTYGIVFDTRASTDESKRLLEEALQWASKEVGLNYNPLMIKRWQYLSQITFNSKVQLVRAHPSFQKLAETLTKRAAEVSGQTLDYDLTILALDHDPLLQKHPIGRFSIQRRENTPFSDNKYYSEAPLPTDVHIKLLEQFEVDLSGK
jgi:hypothetical protein